MLPLPFFLAQPTEIASWNSPLDVTFAFSSADAWPTLLLTVMETDAHGRQDLGQSESSRGRGEAGLVLQNWDQETRALLVCAG